MSSSVRFEPSTRSVFLAGWLAALMLAGCQTIGPNDPRFEPPLAPNLEPPRELSKVSLPAYRIEPPDVLQIEMVKLVPLPPYRAAVFDYIEVRVANVLPEMPINGYFRIEADGVVNLGSPYGTVRVVGMTLEEIRQAVEKRLQENFRNPEAAIQWAQVTAAPPVSGQHVVGPDGTINLRQYSTVHVAGKTVTEARVAIQKHLSQFLDSPELSIEVLAFQSKFYYVITQGAETGDNVHRIPVTGNETVLDAIANVNGLSQLSSTKMWIARPAPNGLGYQQKLPVDWEAITQGAQTGTNFQIMPGDRVFIAEDQMLTINTVFGKLTGPIERIAGILGLTNSTIRGYQTMGRNYNRTRSGF